MVTLKEAIDRFLKVKKAGGKAPATLKWYEKILSLMERALEDKPLDEIEQDVVIDYLAGLRDNHAPEGADSYTRACKGFWGWASKRYGVQDPTRDIKYPKQRQPKPQAMTEDDFRKLFELADNREQAILAIFLATGGRVSEVLQLRVSKIDWQNRRHLITGKGSKQRYIFWDTYTSEILGKWIHARDSKEDAVFTSEKGTALTYDGLYQALKRLAKKAEIKGKFNPHSIRHLYGKLKTASGQNSISLSKLMGHSDPKLTATTYAQFEPLELGALADEHSTVKKILD